MRRLLLISLCLPLLIRFTLAQTQFNIDRIESATIFILQAQTIGNQLAITCVGSGTIVSREGLILTNAHNTVESDLCPGNELIIALQLHPNEPPTPVYRATIAQFEIGIDLALLRIAQDLSGRDIVTSNLSLPFVELGNSDTLALDDTITIVGYPDLENGSVEATRGTVTGFIAEMSGGNQSWIKTSAIIPGTMSGGGAYNESGQLVGIPVTISPSRFEGDCKIIEDSNQDGIINDSDFCVPIGRFINILRPARFAEALIRGASLDLQIEQITSPRFQGSSSSNPSFSNLFIASSISNNMPSSIVGSLPTGIDSVYLFFDYANMSPEDVYELQVNLNGIPNPTFSLPPVRWSGGENGLWYIGSTGQRWQNGIYDFNLSINGFTSGNLQLVIGGGAEDIPAFSNIVFGIESGGGLIGNGYVLPSGTIASAQFIYQNMPQETPWSTLWFYNNQMLAREDFTWSEDQNGAFTTRIRSVDATGAEVPLIPGNYRTSLYIDGRLSALSDFVVAGIRDGALPRIFSDIRFVSADNPQDAPLANPTTNFPAGLEQIYALFNWDQIAAGTLWTMRWSIDNNIFYEQTVPWNATQSGSDFITALTSLNGIPDGTYQLDLLVNDVMIVSETFEVGIGQLPIDEFAQADGIRLSGTIYDGETGNGISGVTFALISEDFSIEDFVWEQEQIYSLAITDRNGNFVHDRPLEFEAPYSVYIIADGYLPIRADGYIITEEDGLQIEMSIPLTKD